MFMRRIIVLILMSAVIQTVSAGWHNINVDFTTITAMRTAYGVEGAEGGNTATALDSIFQHYTLNYIWLIYFLLKFSFS